MSEITGAEFLAQQLVQNTPDLSNNNQAENLQEQLGSLFTDGANYLQSQNIEEYDGGLQGFFSKLPEYIDTLDDEGKDKYDEAMGYLRDYGVLDFSNPDITGFLGDVEYTIINQSAVSSNNSCLDWEDLTEDGNYETYTSEYKIQERDISSNPPIDGSITAEIGEQKIDITADTINKLADENNEFKAPRGGNQVKIDADVNNCYSAVILNKYNVGMYDKNGVTSDYAAYNAILSDFVAAQNEEKGVPLKNGKPNDNLIYGLAYNLPEIKEIRDDQGNITMLVAKGNYGTSGEKEFCYIPYTDDEGNTHFKQIEASELKEQIDAKTAEEPVQEEVAEEPVQEEVAEEQVQEEGNDANTDPETQELGDYGQAALSYFKGEGGITNEEKATQAAEIVNTFFQNGTLEMENLDAEQSTAVYGYLANYFEQHQDEVPQNFKPDQDKIPEELKALIDKCNNAGFNDEGVQKAIASFAKFYRMDPASTEFQNLMQQIMEQGAPNGTEVPSADEISTDDAPTASLTPTAEMRVTTNLHKVPNTGGGSVSYTTAEAKLQAEIAGLDPDKQQAYNSIISDIQNSRNSDLIGKYEQLSDRYLKGEISLDEFTQQLLPLYGQLGLTGAFKLGTNNPPPFTPFNRQ